jgi:predicted ATPase
MEAYSSEVLSRSDCSALDKISLYETKANKLSSLDLKYEETIDFCLKVLKELDLKLMLHSALQPIQAISSLLRTVRMAKKTAEQVYEDLKPMNDPKQDAVMALLARLINASFLCNNEFVLIMASTKMVRLTLQYGVNAHSGFGFSTLGLLTLAVLGDLETGLFFAEMALLMQKKVSVKYTAVITHFVAFDFVFPWKLPLLFCSSPFLDAYKSGMRAGNTEYALWCLASHQVLIPFVTGKPLGVLLKQCQNCVSQMEEFNQQEQVLLMRLYLQMLLNLTGKSKERTRLQGEAFNLVEFENATPLNDATIKMLQTALFIFFGDFESAANLALQCRDNYEKIAPAHFLGMTETFHRGVALYAMARHTRKREYIKAAKLVKKTITKWTESGNPNVRYFHSFLNAEQAAVDKDYKKAGTFYQEAIVAAARTGYLHHAALCNERYADFLRKELGDEDEASYRMEEAIRFYGDWGAEAKVEMLMDPLK